MGRGYHIIVLPKTIASSRDAMEINPYTRFCHTTVCCLERLVPGERSKHANRENDEDQ